MQKKSIIVLGSTNTDMVIAGKKIPEPGETVSGGTFLMNPGGKGANQAVAVARLGGSRSRPVGGSEACRGMSALVSPSCMVLGHAGGNFIPFITISRC